MMHFSIPTSSNITDSKDNTYTVYNLQINGVHHCSIRYSQLHHFNAQLKKDFNPSFFTLFPSKKLLSLSSAQIEDRRVELERYIQKISQVPEIVSSNAFTTFFLNAQKESMQEVDEEVDIAVDIPGACQLMVHIHSTDQTMLVYQATVKQLNLPHPSRPFFGLFLLHHTPDGYFTIIRRLQGFECPLISLKNARVESGSVLVGIRKIYWDIEYDKELMNDKTTLKILVALAKQDLENGWVRCGSDEESTLKQLLKQGSKKEYMRMMWGLPQYGHILSHKSYTDFPQADTEVIVALGGQQICLLLDDRSREFSFKVTRIRCWRISSISKDNCSSCISSLGPEALELSLEYLVSKDSLRWISIYSSQAILISMCLQSIVDELIMTKNGGHIGKRDDSTSSTNALANKLSYSRLNEMDFEEQKYFTKNNAFDEIKDDDL